MSSEYNEEINQKFMMGFFLFFIVVIFFVSMTLIFDYLKSSSFGSVNIVPTYPFDQNKFHVYEGDHGEKVFFENGPIHRLQDVNFSTEKLRRILKKCMW